MKSLVKVLFGLALGLVVISYPGEVGAQQNSISEVWSRAAVMAPGQRVFNFSSSFVQFSKEFRADGGAVPLGDAYAQKLTWLDVIGGGGVGAPENLELQNYLIAHGINLNDVAAVTDVEVRQDLWQFAPEAAFGLTKRWTLGFRVPILYRQTDVKTNVVLINEIPADPGLASNEVLTAQKIRQRSQQALQERLNEMNYKDRDPEGEWLLGDVELLSKYLIHKGSDLVFSVRQRVSVPTSSGPNPYRYVEISPADGQLDVGVDAIADYWLGAGWSLTGIAGYTWQAPDQIRMRLPQTASPSPATQDLDFEVDRKMGDYVRTDMFVEKRVQSSWRGLLGYSYYRKFRDEFGGAAFTEDRYKTLSQGTDREQHAGLLGISYWLEPFQERFGIKDQLVTRLYVSRVLSGKNVPAATTTGLDLQLFF